VAFEHIAYIQNLIHHRAEESHSKSGSWFIGKTAIAGVAVAPWNK